MRLNEEQTGLLKFLYDRFPTPYRETGDEIRPRSKYQPPTRREAVEALKIDDAMWDDMIAFLTAHGLAHEVYRNGTEEYERMTVAPGRTILAPVAAPAPPPDVDPGDERFGVYCYQITDRGIQLLNGPAAPRQEAHSMNDHTAPRHPRAFMSYSWDDEPHKGWVQALAAKLRRHGIDVTLDLWALAPGDQLPRFMETAVRENEHVLIVCTPKYKEKSDARKGGVGYEGDIMTAEVLNGQDARKFIPLLRQGEWKDVAPSWLAGRFYLDFRGDPYSEEKYEELLDNVHGTREQAPPLGERPEKSNHPRLVGYGKLELPPPPEEGPIRIKGIILEEIGTPRNDGTKGSALYTVPFRLSRRPSSEWAQHFVQTWDYPPSFTTMH
jgi:hypothetical protein